MGEKYKTKGQMEDLAKKIIKAFKEDKSVFLVGKTDGGKTYFVKNFLIPFLKERNIKNKYFKNVDEFSIEKNLDLAIIDEVEILSDQEFLEKEHPEEIPFYTKEYLIKVRKWGEKLSTLNIPSIFIITRNTNREFKFIKDNVTKTEWNSTPIIVLEYKN